MVKHRFNGWQPSFIEQNSTALQSLNLLQREQKRPKANIKTVIYIIQTNEEPTHSIFIILLATFIRKRYNYLMSMLLLFYQCPQQ